MRGVIGMIRVRRGLNGFANLFGKSRDMKVCIWHKMVYIWPKKVWTGPTLVCTKFVKVVN